MTSFREELDSMGTVEVPDWALWGASTERARRNFLDSGRKMPLEAIHAIALVKQAAAEVNRDLGKLDPRLAELIVQAAKEVAAGRHDDHFVVDLYQTGSGTSSNTNVNEVLANRANQIAGMPLGSRTPIHPNDQVNLGQSSNDVFPTAMHLAASRSISNRLLPALSTLQAELDRLAENWAPLLKLGRTHLMDATPIRIGQVFSGYAAQVEKSISRIGRALEGLRELPIGGTAVGTGVNTHPEFGARVAARLAEMTGIGFVEAPNHFEAQAAKDAFVDLSGAMKTLAVSLSKIANDLRWLGSGPRGGLGELILPALQPGSSIMPGKVNPVICESAIQAMIRVISNDSVVTYSGFGGVGSIFELNVAMPLIIDAVLESVGLLAGSCTMLAEKLLGNLEVDRARCEKMANESLMLATRLAPVIGYDRAAEVAKTAFSRGQTVREAAQGLLAGPLLDELLDPSKMTAPDKPGQTR